MKGEIITWEMVNRAFAPFAGSSLYAIRADAYFHLLQSSSSSRRSRLKNVVYPLVLSARASHVSAKDDLPLGGQYVFVCDYPAEPGFGSVWPLISTCDAPSTTVVNRAVLRARHRQLATSGTQIVCADRHPSSWVQWRELWLRSKSDYECLYESSCPALRQAIFSSRLLLRSLLVRAYLYEQFYEWMFWVEMPRAVITHNDFTSLSYLAGAMARRYGIPDFTLQHGFPSQEYFPPSASHYLLWGPAFRDKFREYAIGEDRSTQFATVGAPRLDAIGRASTTLQEISTDARRPIKVLFLSQSHTPVFTPEEHARVLTLVSALTDKPWLRLSVRRHPQESKSGFRRFPGFKKAKFISPKLSLRDSLMAEDVVISVNSTAMLEAALFQRPVLQISLPEFAARQGVLRFPLQVSDLHSTLSTLRRLRDARERESYVHAQHALVEACVSAPGKGTETVWRYIRAFQNHDHPLPTVIMQGAR